MAKVSEVPSRRRAVFLDRDGVLNETHVHNGASVPPPDLGSLRLMLGATDACRELRDAGLLLVIVTNQPDIARGTQRQGVVDAINSFVATAIVADDTYCCPHDTADGCACRKPRPGMLLAAAERWNIDLHRSVMIGDRVTDVEAGINAGCATVLIGYAKPHPANPIPDAWFPSLRAATPWIIHRTEGQTDV